VSGHDLWISRSGSLILAGDQGDLDEGEYPDHAFGDEAVDALADPPFQQFVGGRSGEASGDDLEEEGFARVPLDVATSEAGGGLDEEGRRLRGEGVAGDLQGLQ